MIEMNAVERLTLKHQGSPSVFQSEIRKHESVRSSTRIRDAAIKPSTTPLKGERRSSVGLSSSSC